MKGKATSRLKSIRTRCWALAFVGLLIGLMATPFVAGCQGRAGQAGPEPNAGRPQGTVVVSVLHPTTAAPAHGVVVSQSLEVIDVEAGSVAEQASIQRGDVLKTVNDTPLASAADAARVISRVEPGQHMTIMLRRSGQDVTLQIVIARPPTHPGQPTATPVPPDRQYI